MFKEITQYFHRLSFNRVKQQAFLEDASSLIADGVSAQQTFATIQNIYPDIEKEVAGDILKSLSEGKYIADGMDGWFPDHIIAIVRSGEDSGTLVSTMHAAAVALMQGVSVFSSLASSLTYPLIVLLLACGVAIFLKHSIFTNFAAIKPVSGWPEVGKTFLFFAAAIEFWWWLIILGVVGLIFAIQQTLQIYIGEGRKFFDDFPPFSTYRAFVGANFMGILGLLISNGISFKDALTIVQRNASRYLIWHIYMMQLRLGSGKENIAEVLDTGLLSEENIIRLKVIAQGKGFEHALVRLGEQAAKKNVKQLETIGRILGGLLLAIDAGIAVFMILSVYSVGTFIGGS